MNTAQNQRIEFLRGKGESYSSIAGDLGISENTVKSYCRRGYYGAAEPRFRFEVSHYSG